MALGILAHWVFWHWVFCHVTVCFNTLSQTIQAFCEALALFMDRVMPLKCFFKAALFFKD